MCGIAGAWAKDPKDSLGDALRPMASAISHRGPDDGGIWTDPEHGITLLHRRLAIVDLSPAGHQPMASPSGALMIVYNGEVYNHDALRGKLARQGLAPQWRGHSDTETLLACIESWGIERTLREAVGMFAFGLWDRTKGTLTLARDRFGEKPLYYGRQGNQFLFGSELKALAAHPAFERRINPDAVAQLLRYNYVAGPQSIWSGVRKLPPGTLLTLRSVDDRDAVPIAYWSLIDIALDGIANPLDLDDGAATDHLEAVLKRAVCGQMMADVPLGALLSGGVDSSLIVALMQSQSTRPVRTFSIGFHEKRFDESGHAALVAAHLGTDHTTLMMTADDVLNAVPRMPDIYDEPFADSSQLPTTLVMALARQHVTVALSGDAGDELFGGYNRYLFAPKLWKSLRLVPAPLRSAVAQMMTKALSLNGGSLSHALDRLPIQANLGDKAYKLAARLGPVRSIDDLYASMLAEWGLADVPVLSGSSYHALIDDRGTWPAIADPVARMMAIDSVSYLPDDILVKVDRAAMAASLETRAPFLDHRVAEAAWTLPMHQKLRDGRGKWVLREILDRYVPRTLIERPKMGFGVPINDWLRGPLKGWASDLLSEDRLRRQGLLDAEIVGHQWRDHLSGRRQLGSRLWSVLMLQAWLDRQGM